MNTIISLVDTCLLTAFIQCRVISHTTFLQRLLVQIKKLPIWLTLLELLPAWTIFPISNQTWLVITQLFYPLYLILSFRMPLINIIVRTRVLKSFQNKLVILRNLYCFQLTFSSCQTRLNWAATSASLVCSAYTVQRTSHLLWMSRTLKKQLLTPGQNTVHLL